MNSILNILSLAVSVHAACSATGTAPFAFITPSSHSAHHQCLPSTSSDTRTASTLRIHDTSSVSSLFSSKVDRRPDTQRFNNLIYATDDTVQLLREELKSRLLKAADEFNAMDRKKIIESTRTSMSNATFNTQQDEDGGNYVSRLLLKIVRKISRRGSPAAPTCDTVHQQQQQEQQQQQQSRVSGGILSSDSFRQAKLEVGELGKKVIEMAEQLSLLNPTPIPTLGFKHYGGAPPSESKLNGQWKLRFTTAADATFSTSEKRGVITTSQVIDAIEGTLTNVVDFEKGKLKGFRVIVEGEPISETTMRLSFKKVKLLRKSRFPRLFGEITIRLPSRLIRWLGSSSRKDEKEETDENTVGPYLQLRYLDDTLRMHTTNTGNWFIQTRL